MLIVSTLQGDKRREKISWVPENRTHCILQGLLHWAAREFQLVTGWKAFRHQLKQTNVVVAVAVRAFKMTRIRFCGAPPTAESFLGPQIAGPFISGRRVRDRAAAAQVMNKSLAAAHFVYSAKLPGP